MELKQAESLSLRLKEERDNDLCLEVIITLGELNEGDLHLWLHTVFASFWSTLVLLWQRFMVHELPVCDAMFR